MEKVTLVAKIRVVLNFPSMTDTAKLKEIEKVLDEEREDATAEMVAKVFGIEETHG